MKICTFIKVFALLILLPNVINAADLPAHQALRILIVSDEVNPHGLQDAELTQPGDISNALQNPLSGISIENSADAVLEVATDNLPIATSALSVPLSSQSAYDVLIYFAHRTPNTANALQEQNDFDTAVTSFLQQGGGVVVFHHGIYLDQGKETLLNLFGGSATGSVIWDTVDGQNVINVSPQHFIASNGIEYPVQINYEDTANNILQNSYDAFVNDPDEKYPEMTLVTSSGNTEILFTSDYNLNGNQHVLGYIHQKSGWQGVVVVYQPGEYQPNALDDVEGNNFQILANSILFAAGMPVIAAQTKQVPAMDGVFNIVLLLLIICIGIFYSHYIKRVN